MNKKLRLLLMILMMLAFPTVADAKLAPGDFIDIQKNQAQQEIEAVCSLGLMNGTGTTAQGYRVFAPEAKVTRSELASALVRTFQLDYGQIRFIKEPQASDYYRDVNNQAWYAQDVVLCAINNIFDSMEDQHFYPETTITRIELTTAIYRCFNAKGISVPMIMIMPTYDDMQGFSQDDINAMVFVNNTGIMKGDGRYFRPGEAVTRADLAVVLSRCASLLALNEDENGQEYTIPVGQRLTISLASNLTTGYTWNTFSPWDEKVLAQTASDIYLSDSTTNSAVVGQGGRSYWQFKALQPGSTEICLGYARPWESKQPEKTFNLKVKVIPQGEQPEGVSVICNLLKSQSDTLDVDLNIPMLQGMANERAQSFINAQWEKEAMDFKDQVASGIDEYVKNARQYGYPINQFQALSRYQKCYQDEKILSLYVDYYQYTGGAHGGTERRAYNVDLATGQNLAFKDLFKDNYDYKTVIDQAIRQQISSNPGAYFTGDMGFNGIADNPNYYLQDGYLVVYFQQYEIAPYASGIPEFKVPLSELKDGLKLF